MNQFFTPNQIQILAEEIKGFSGRSIDHMLNSIYNKQATTSNGKLTQGIIDEKIYQFIQQEKEGELLGDRPTSVKEGD